MPGESNTVLQRKRVLRLGTHLPPSGRAPAEARDFVACALRSWHVGHPQVDDIVLATSELVTNAYEHGRGGIALRLRCTSDNVVLEVRDGAGEDPVLRRPGPHSAHGRGLALVAAISTTWGHDRAGDGKWVWAEFSLS